MAKVAVPIINLDYPAAFALTNEIHDVFESEGVWNGVEDFTFTGRISLTKGASKTEDAEVEKKRDRLKNRLREVLKDEAGYLRLIQILDENNWDVSFFVDCW